MPCPLHSACWPTRSAAAAGSGVVPFDVAWDGGGDGGTGGTLRLPRPLPESEGYKASSKGRHRITTLSSSLGHPESPGRVLWEPIKGKHAFHAYNIHPAAAQSPQSRGLLQVCGNDSEGDEGIGQPDGCHNRCHCCSKPALLNGPMIRPHERRELAGTRGLKYYVMRSVAGNAAVLEHGTKGGPTRHLSARHASRERRRVGPRLTGNRFV